MRHHHYPTKYLPESFFAKMFKKHVFLTASFMTLGLAIASWYFQDEYLFFLSRYWEKPAVTALVLFAFAVVFDRSLGVGLRFKTVAHRCGIRNSSGETPTCWWVRPKGRRTIRVRLSLNSVRKEKLSEALPTLGESFGYDRVILESCSKNKAVLTFTNEPSVLEQDCVKPLKLKGQQFLVGVDEKGQEFFLETNNIPGMIVGGNPGSGKTVFLRRTVKSFAKNPRNHVVVFDGKGSRDFKDLASKNVSVLSGTPDMNDDILLELEKLHEELLRRGNESFQGRIVIVIDECQGFMPVKGRRRGEKDLRADTAEIIKDFVARGRSLGFLTVLATQRPDADTIPTEIRDLCELRVCGKIATTEASKMILGDGLQAAKDLKPGQLIIKEGGEYFTVKVAFE